MDIHGAAVAAGLVQADLKPKSKTIFTTRGKDRSLFSKSLIDQTEASDESDEVSSKEVETLLDEVFMLGEKLKKDYALDSLADYRRVIKRFFNYILDEAYLHKTVNGPLNTKTMLERKYAVVQTINDKLDKLAHAIVREQKDLFDILSKVNEINGLIINFMV